MKGAEKKFLHTEFCPSCRESWLCVFRWNFCDARGVPSRECGTVGVPTSWSPGRGYRRAGSKQHLCVNPFLPKYPYILCFTIVGPCFVVESFYVYVFKPCGAFLSSMPLFYCNVSSVLLVVGWGVRYIPCRGGGREPEEDMER